MTIVCDSETKALASSGCKYVTAREWTALRDKPGRKAGFFFLRLTCRPGKVRAQAMREFWIPLALIGCSAFVSIVIGVVGWVLNKIWASFEHETKKQNGQLESIQEMVYQVRERLMRVETKLGFGEKSDAE